MMRRLMLASAVVFAAARGAAAQDMGLPLGSAGPTAAVETLYGKSADLGAWVGKTPLLLEFWATWCPNCRQLEPTLKAMHAKYGAKMKFVGVAVSVNQSPERVRAYIAKHALPWDQVFDRRGDASGAYDAPATSYIVVLDKGGRVVYTGLGGDQDLEPAIRKALGG